VTGGWERHRRRVTLAMLALPVLAVGLLFLAPMVQLAGLSVEDGSLAGYAELLRPVYFRLMLFTFELAAAVTLLCVLLGYPLAYLLATMPSRQGRLIMIVLLLSLWLGILARTYGWVVILQRRGILNELLESAGLIGAPLALVYNQTGVYIGMVHILLPFMVITLIPLLRAIDPVLVRSATSLGATPWFAFRRVYLPLSVPGVLAGGMLCFAMAIGFFVTPAILGGGRASTIIMAIKNQLQVLVDLRLAAATSIVLLVLSVAALVLCDRIAGVDRIFGAARR
jgi:ABC-type spermidine/putrescine transport system permease subunit I